MIKRIPMRGGDEYDGLTKSRKFHLWETGRHSFTFVTGDDRVTALDSLTDLIESLLDIHHEIVKTTDDDMPYSYKVEGGVTHTNIKTHTYIKTQPRVWNE